MTQETLQSLSGQIDDVFFIIGAAILLIEVAETLFKGDHKGRTFWEMVVSASTQIPSIAVEVLILTAGYGVLFVLSDMFVPWVMPLTWGTAVLAVLAADIIYYWEHRIAHQVRLLWTQHAVHHSSRDYNIITGIRFGPLEGLWSLIAHTPLIFLGFPPELVFFGMVVVLAYQTWIHTETIGRLGVLDRIFNTPSNHRVHHGSDDKYLDRNYGGILIIWDRLWGTFQAEEETPRYGLKRDFNSRNPLQVWFSEIPGLWRDVRDARTWGDAWNYLLKGPGWRPEKSPDRSE